MNATKELQDIMDSVAFDYKKENALLREALDAVEWVWVADDEGLRLPKCPWCGGLRWRNFSTEKFQVAHAPNCLRQEALK